MSLLQADKFKTWSTVCICSDPAPALLLSKVTCSDEHLKNSVKNSKQILLRTGIAEYTLLAVEMVWSSEVQMVDLLERDTLHDIGLFFS